MRERSAEKRQPEISNYFGRLVGSETGWGFDGAELPASHDKHISKITGSARFREKVEEDLNNVFNHISIGNQTYIEVVWSNSGVTFRTDGSCCCAFDYKGKFTTHNVDTAEQASALFIAIYGVYIPNLFYVLEGLEKDPTFLTDSKDVGDSGTITKIKMWDLYKKSQRDASSGRVNETLDATN